jgi:hypothetical protein
LKFKRGEISPADYLEQSGAVADYLEKQGVPIETLQLTASKQFEQSWEDATKQFLHCAEGASWPGGQQNLEVIGLTIANLGLTEAEDKRGALVQAWKEMQRKGTIFDPGPSPTDVLKATASMTPAEILQAWKEQHGGENADPNAANQAFVKAYSSSGSGSSLFGQS